MKQSILKGKITPTTSPLKTQKEGFLEELGMTRQFRSQNHDRRSMSPAPFEKKISTHEDLLASEYQTARNLETTLKGLDSPEEIEVNRIPESSFVNFSIPS